MNEEKSKIYVGNLEFSVNEDELGKFFEEKGIKTQEITVIKDRYTGRSKGFAFVVVENPQVLEQAIKNLDGQELKGRSLKVSKARAPKPRF